jgi:AcrR family transcriptional regulator
MSSTFSNRPRADARKPVRKSAQERYELLLDATDRVLADGLNEDVSLAQIATIAEVPLASVYHFFPNRNAAFVALAQRFHAELRYLASQPHQPPPGSWQDMVAMNQRRAAAFLNARPAALRLFMGAGVSVQVRNTDMLGNAALTRMRVDQFNQLFDMPRVPDLELRLAVALAVSEGVWALSYSSHERITDAFIEESVRAAVSYLRCFLPEFVPLRAA